MLAILLAAELLGAEVLERVRTAGHPHVRYSHGFVFQVLVPGPASIGQLAAELGLTSQAVSQSVAELERLGYVERRASEHDGRRRIVALTKRGKDAVSRGRRVRTSLGRELARAIGEGRTAAMAAALADSLEARGGIEAIAARRVRPVGG